MLTLICMKQFCNVTTWNGSLGRLTKGNILIEITKKVNNFSLTKIKLECYLTRKTLESNRLAQNIFFSRMGHHTAKTNRCWFYLDPNTIFLAKSFNWKMAESSDFKFPPIFMLKIYDTIFLPKVGRIHKKLWISFHLWAQGNPIKLKQQSQFLVNSDPFR